MNESVLKKGLLPMFRRHLGPIMLVLAILVLVSIGTLIPSKPEYAAGGPCTCGKDEILDNIRTANTVFYGRIVKARMKSFEANHIELTVEPKDFIRGSAPDVLTITTTLPQNCGVGAVIGRHELFVIQESDMLLTRCSGSGLPYNKDGFTNLFTALITVEYLESNPDKMLESLHNHFYSDYRREWMRDYFTLLEGLDPGSSVYRSANTVRYKRLVFEFANDELATFYLDSPE